MMKYFPVYIKSILLFSDSTSISGLLELFVLANTIGSDDITVENRINISTFMRLIEMNMPDQQLMLWPCENLALGRAHERDSIKFCCHTYGNI